MNIYIFSLNKRIYSTSRLVEEAYLAGHDVRVVNHTQCSVLIGDENPYVYYKGENIIDAPDVIIPRVGASVSRHGAAIVKQFEMNGIYSTARSLGILRAHNKLRTLQILNRKHIPIPKTVFSIDPDNIDEQIELLGEMPVIIKLQEGTQGLGVILAESKKSAKSIIDTFYNINANILLQEFIEESNGEDIRAFVVGNKIVAAMKRKGREGEFRSNVHRGGATTNIRLTRKEKTMALRAAAHLGLPVAGVDLIRSNRGPLLIEVNASPGLEGIEGATGVNIAGEIIKFLEKNVRK